MLCSITSDQFIAAFQMNREVFACTKGLSQLLQGSPEDVVKAYGEVKVVKDTLSGLRTEAEEKHARIFSSTKEMLCARHQTMNLHLYVLPLNG